MPLSLQLTTAAGTGLKNHGSGFRVWGLGFRVWGSGLGSRFKVLGVRPVES